MIIGYKTVTGAKMDEAKRKRRWSAGEEKVIRGKMNLTK